MRRRTAFAAPFVLVLGCKRPIEPPAAGEHEVESGRAPTSIPADAGFAWPDFDVPDPFTPEPLPDAPDAAVRATCGRQPDGRMVTCNPPPPDAARPLQARILAVEVDGNHFRVKLAIGAAQGVAPSWRGILVDRNDTPIVGGELVLIRVDDHQTIASTRVSTDALRYPVFARLSPP